MGIGTKKNPYRDFKAFQNKIKRKEDAMKYVTRGDIYYVGEKEAIGSEQGGNRPAVIVSSQAGNKTSPIVLIVFLTCQTEKRLSVHPVVNSSRRPSVAICEQITTISKERLKEKIGTVTKEEMEAIDKAILLALGISPEKIDCSTEDLLEQYSNLEFVQLLLDHMEKARKLGEKYISLNQLLEKAKDIEVKVSNEEVDSYIPNAFKEQLKLDVYNLISGSIKDIEKEISFLTGHYVVENPISPELIIPSVIETKEEEIEIIPSLEVDEKSSKEVTKEIMEETKTETKPPKKAVTKSKTTTKNTPKPHGKRIEYNEVKQSLIEGKKLKEIATKLGVTYSGVYNYVRSFEELEILYSKMMGKEIDENRVVAPSYQKKTDSLKTKKVTESDIPYIKEKYTNGTTPLQAVAKELGVDMKDLYGFVTLHNLKKETSKDQQFRDGRGMTQEEFRAKILKDQSHKK